jgi:signal transduction histidine kinase
VRISLELNLFQKGLVLVCVPLFFSMFFGLILLSIIGQTEEQVREYDRAQRIVQEIKSINENMIRSFETYIANKYSIGSIRDVASALEEIELSRQELSELCIGNEKEMAAFESFEEVVSRLQELVRTGKSLALKITAGEIKGREEIERSLRPLAERARMIVDDFRIASHNLETIASEIEIRNPQEQEKLRALLKQFLIAGVLLNLVLAAALLVFFSAEIISGLNTILENTVRLTREQPLIAEIGSTDEIGRLDREFHKMSARLHELERTKQEFYAMVTHDLRSPLQAIGGTMALLRDGACGELPQEALHRMTNAERSIKRLSGLINDLLDLEKLEAGKFDMDFDEVPLQPLLLRAVEDISISASDREITIQVECDESIQVYVDADRMVQVLINLLSNAIKYSPGNETVHLVAVANEDWATVSVRDRGPGIPPVYLQEVFERFKQVKDSPVKGGTGLGLAICKLIVEQHRGQIGVENMADGGARFWFKVQAM